MPGLVPLLQHSTIKFGRAIHCGGCHYRGLLQVAVAVALAGDVAAAFGVAHAGTLRAGTGVG